MAQGYFGVATLFRRDDSPYKPRRGFLPVKPTSSFMTLKHSLRTVFTKIIVVLAGVAALFQTGCDVRDEEAFGSAASPWPPQVVDRLATPIQRSPQSEETNRTIVFLDGYATGARRAAEVGLPMMLVFRASWCRWSDALVAAIPVDPELAAMANRFVCIAVDADRDLPTCRSFGIQAFPTVILLDQNGRETFRATGAAARAGLAVAVQSLLEAPVPRIAAQPDSTPR